MSKIKKSKNEKEVKNINSLEHVYNQFIVLQNIIMTEKCKLDAKYELSQDVTREINYKKKYKYDEKTILQAVVDYLKDIITRKESIIAACMKWKEVEEFTGSEIEVTSEWSDYDDYDIELSKQMIVTAKQFIGILEESIKGMAEKEDE